MTMNVFMLFIAFLLCYGLTGCLLHHAQALNLIDVPNYRSSHKAPTPRGGGLVFASVFLIISAFFLLPMATSISSLVTFLLAAALILLIGFVDDIRGLSARLRLVTQGIAVLAMMLTTSQYAYLEITLTAWLPIWLLLSLSFIGFIWLINLYNFMDGIDGLAASQGVSVCLIVLIELLAFKADPYFVMITGLMGACLCGFLYWNWAPAKIFMGDAGSAFLGLFFVYLILDGPFPLSTWLILMAGFWVDATVTLIRRMMAGYRFNKPHCNHAYQHLASYWGSHQRITYGIIGLNLLWLFPLSFMSLYWQEYGYVFTLVALIPIFVLVIKAKAGKNL